MFPYFEQPIWQLGPFTFKTFGFLVGVGVVSGLWLVYRRAAQMRIPAGEMRGAARTALVAGFWASIIAEVVFYQPQILCAEGLSAFFTFEHGMSSYGGFLGAFAGLWVYFAIRRERWLAHADVLVQGIVVGWVFGRLGCTFAHDHKGCFSEFFLAFKYPEGARHNLGFYEFLYTLVVLLPAIMVIHHRYGSPRGMHCTLIALLYAPVRFGLDFLRSRDEGERSDARYLGLTFAQYCCVALVLYGLVTIPRTWRGLQDAIAVRTP